jgi:tRNA pseudouridine38-40 synthase
MPKYTNPSHPRPFAIRDTVLSGFPASLLAGTESIAMTNWKITLSYDGGPYRGWQIQPNLPTIQGLLSDALQRTVGERVLPQGSGRTDAGVHALGQVASFSLKAPIPAANLHRALNRCLPPSIRVLEVEIVPPDFHARHSALGKTYEYRIFPLQQSTNPGAPQPGSQASAVARRGGRLDFEMWEENICPPTLAPYVWPCPWPLDLGALNQAASHVLGTHDFTTFAAADPDLTHRTVHTTEPGAPHLDSEMWVGPPPPPIRTITHSQWHASDGLFLYRVTANGFLHHMVRNLVGTFVQCGAHRLDPGSIPALLAARDRAAAGPTAPATGLFLVSVDYPLGSVKPLDPPNYP